MRRILCLTAVLLGACDDDLAPNGNDLAMNADLSASIDLSSMMVDRGPTDLRTNFEPVGLHYSNGALYMTTASNQIVKWTDEGGFELLYTIPFAYAAIGNNLSSLVRLADGRLIVDVIGLNLNAMNQPTPVNGNILIIGTDGSISAVPKLDQTRQRQGLALASDGTIYSGWYKGTGMMMPQGGVSKVDLANGESDVWLGLQKPYGIAVSATALFAADQKQNALFTIALSNTDVDGGTAMKLADLTAPDLMVLGAGDLFVAGGQVSRVKTDGTVTAFSMPARATRGVAYDPDHARLFVSEPDPKFPDAGVMALLHILPVN